MKEANLPKIYTIITAILISVSVLFQGMYHDGPQYAFIGLVAVLVAVAILKGGVDFRPASLLDWFVIATVPVYIISSFTAVSLWDAFACVARYICCYLVYFLIKSIIKNNRLLFYRILYYAGVAASVYGLYSGIAGPGFDAKKSLLLSVFMYHNASAVFCASMFIIGMFLITRADFRERVLICVCNTLLVSTIVYSQSRGTWLVFLICVIAFLIFARKMENFSSVMMSVGAPLLGVLVSMNGFMAAFTVRDSNLFCEDWLKCIVFLLLSIVVSVIVVLLCEKTAIKKLLSPKFAIAVIPAAVIIAFVAFVVLSPGEILQRIKDFSLDSSTVTERQMFFADAMMLFAKNPVTGIGGNCWQYVYPSVQTQHYTVAHPHSIIAEFMTDAGIFGLLLFALLVVALIIALIRFKGEEKLPAKIICILILTHSLFDFDTDYFSLVILLFSCFAIISDREVMRKSSKAFVVLPVILLAWSVLNCLSMLNYNSAMKLASEKAPYSEVYEKTSASVSFMPIKADYLTVHGNVCLALKNDRRYLDEAKEVLEKSHKLNKYHYQTIYQLSVCYLYMGEYEKSGETVSKLVKSQPFLNQTYDYISNIYEMIIEYGLQSNDDDLAVKCTVYACNMMMENYSYAHMISNKYAAYIGMGTRTHANYTQALELMEELNKIGV